MDTLIKEITGRLKTCINGFPSFERLHPFEKSVLDLAVGEANYKRILGNVDKLRRQAVKVLQLFCNKLQCATIALTLAQRAMYRWGRSMHPRPKPQRHQCKPVCVQNKAPMQFIRS